LTDDVVSSLKSLNLSSYPTSYFVIGHELKPNLKPLQCAYLSKHWIKLRKKLNLSKEMQLYSLRDSGIFEMLKSGIDPLSVKQHADHHSLEMTTIYSNHVDPNLAKIIREKAPTF
jgi:site-specific recombinase XerD